MKQLLGEATKKLRSGIDIPQVGFGTFQSSQQEVGVAVKWALETGYRHIDTAKAYGNEKEIGDAIAASSVPREDLFIATKVWMTDYNDVRSAFESSARKLQAEYLDLLMLHWPGTDEKTRLNAFEALLKLREQGLIRSVGVSNFMKEHLEEIKENFGEYPEYNQIQVHPWGQQKGLSDFCKNKGIVIAAWGPLMHGYLKDAHELEYLGEKYSHTLAQVILRWHLQKGNIIIPKSVNKTRIEENANIFNFELSQEDMAVIDSQERDWHWGPDAFTFNGE
jgi:diketogulonate reductase-like aldo/keto reductase